MPHLSQWAQCTAEWSCSSLKLLEGKWGRKILEENVAKYFSKCDSAVCWLLLWEKKKKKLPPSATSLKSLGCHQPLDAAFYRLFTTCLSQNRIHKSSFYSNNRHVRQTFFNNKTEHNSHFSLNNQSIFFSIYCFTEALREPPLFTHLYAIKFHGEQIHLMRRHFFCIRTYLSPRAKHLPHMWFLCVPSKESLNWEPIKFLDLLFLLFYTTLCCMVVHAALLEAYEGHSGATGVLNEIT